MRCIHVISGLAASGGGPSRSVPSLAASLARRGFDVELLTLRSPGMATPREAESLLRVFRPTVAKLAYSRELGDYLQRVVRERDVCHGHGVWELPVHAMCDAARRWKRPYLIAPRGMLDDWALKLSRRRKRLMGFLFQDDDLRNADCIHALAQNEVRSCREYGLRNPIALVPNGVDLRQFADLDRYVGRLAEKFSAVNRRPIMLFLSRVHPKKGLVPLLDAWAGLRRQFPDWLLVIAGPDQLGHRAELEAKIAAGGLGANVLLTGALYGEGRLAALATADVFVLPSYSEGFSMAVLEALACGLPVVISPGCNFPEVEESGAGVVCEPAADALREALARMLGLRPEQRREMGRRGRRLVEEQFTWDRQAARMAEVYHWLVHGDARPECVRMD